MSLPESWRCRITCRVLRSFNDRGEGGFASPKDWERREEEIMLRIRGLQQSSVYKSCIGWERAQSTVKQRLKTVGTEHVIQSTEVKPVSPAAMCCGLNVNRILHVS